MVHRHTVRSYDEDLNRLRSLITRMAGLAETQISDGVSALIKRNDDIARQVIAADKALDIMENEAEQTAIELIALRSPMADDLREIVSALKISSILERIGDYGKNIAKRSLVLNQSEPIKTAVIIPQMAAHAKTMLKDAMDAFIDRDSDKAMMVWQSDKAIDGLNSSLFRELLTYMMENPRLITPCTHLLFVSKNIERIGDHVTNIAEIVYYLVTGNRLDQDRPKGDESATISVTPPTVR
ncbi:MAG: phosphate transport system regulatory protein PhoU [Proteobacteria bacterium]|jgi:phosphate transport system protein|nr:MAG: phosphate transport system regulatory protein PhoU [Pseudomonadota bacterium]